MKQNRQLIIAICASAGMLALILDSKTALQGAAEGIDLCIKTVIPNLFPFFVLSSLLISAITTIKVPFLQSLGKLCGIPQGGETILLIGLLGGYPIGAQCVSQAYSAGRLSRTDARRMLGFCSNAGPAFLFGMTGALFENRSIPIILWMMHICSALLTGVILPSKSTDRITSNPHSTNGQPLPTALRNMGIVCGWVILFRIVIKFVGRWFLWLVPKEITVFLTGILELTNGYLDLAQIRSEQLRFIFASIFLAFGGMCVSLQTVSITGQTGLGTGYYFPGKIIQAAINTALAIPVSSILFTGNHVTLPIILPLFIIIIAIIIHFRKNLKIYSSIPGSSGV